MNKFLKNALAVTLALTVIFTSALCGSVAYAKSIRDNLTGDIIELGSYPQSEVKDIDTIDRLSSQEKDWISYGYMSGNSDIWSDGSAKHSDYMKYCDVELDGTLYRGVEFSSYRPYPTNYKSDGSTSFSFQDDNGYCIKTTYWFKFEPLKWRVLDPSTGLAVCESIIDSQPYSDTIFYSDNEYYKDAECTIFANNYYESSIGAWLNNEFFGTAFTDEEQATINKSILRENKAGAAELSKYDSASSANSVFLLSVDEITNADFGFSKNVTDTDISRRASGTDYAKCQGLWVSGSTSLLDNRGNRCSNWLLRSASEKGNNSFAVTNGGDISGTSRVDQSFNGIRPAINILPKYKITWKIDGMTTYSEYTVGEKTVQPEEPSKEGCIFKGWSPEIPEFMPEEDVTITAVFEKIYVPPVEKNITKLEIATLPSKMSYTYKKDSFDPSGLTLTATYSDGSKQLVSNVNEMEFSGFTNTSTGDHMVTVTYDGMTAEFKINVSYAWWQIIIRIFLLGFIWY